MPSWSTAVVQAGDLSMHRTSMSLVRIAVGWRAIAQRLWEAREELAHRALELLVAAHAAAGHLRVAVGGAQRDEEHQGALIAVGSGPLEERLLVGAGRVA